MKGSVTLRSSLGNVVVQKWSKKGGKVERPWTLPIIFEEFLLLESVPTAPSIKETSEYTLDELINFPSQKEIEKITSVKRYKGRVTEATVHLNISPTPAQKAKTRSAAAQRAINKLDAYGHLTWVTDFGEEGGDEGDLMFALDFKVFREKSRKYVAYHIVVNSESGHFIETQEEVIVPASQAPYDLPLATTDMGGDLSMTPRQWEDAEKINESWNRALKSAIKNA